MVLSRVVVALGVVMFATPASAGRLGEVAQGTRSQAGSSSRSSGGGGGTKSGGGGGSSDAGDTQTTRDRRRHRSGYVDPFACLGCPVYGYSSATVTETSRQGALQPGAPPHVDAYLGVQSVVESDFSGSVHVRGRVSWMGVEAGATTFVERFPKEGGDEYLRLDMWNVGATFRLLGHDDGAPPEPEVFASFGLTRMSTLDVGLIGMHAGLDARLPVAGEVELLGTAAVRLFEADVRAMEARAGVSLSFFQLSYRVTDFNTGPALHGPEVGLQWRY